MPNIGDVFGDVGRKGVITPIIAPQTFFGFRAEYTDIESWTPESRKSNDTKPNRSIRGMVRQPAIGNDVRALKEQGASAVKRPLPAARTPRPGETPAPVTWPARGESMPVWMPLLHVNNYNNFCRLTGVRPSIGVKAIK